MDDILKRLRKLWVHRVGTDDDLVSIYREAADEIERLRKERDEARQEVCIMRAESLGNIFGGSSKSPQEYADERGWGCFKENTDG